MVAWWCALMALLSLVVVAALGLPWNAALGGVTAHVTGQLGAVVPGLVVATILLGLFGLGFGTLVKNQVAAILLTIGFTFILEPHPGAAGPGHLPVRPQLAAVGGRRIPGRLAGRGVWAATTMRRRTTCRGGPVA